MPVLRAGALAEGIVTVTDRPPSSRGRAVTVPPWIAAMDATMARPSPKPSLDVRSLSRSNGWKMRRAPAGLTTGPVLATVSWLLPAAVRVLIQMSPASALYRTAFGFVFQFGQLVPELTAADNVALPLLLNRTKRKVAYKTAAAWLGSLGIGDKGGRRTGELSGGEAQRVAVARALALAPKVIFADEPTGSLDSLTGEKTMDLLMDLARQQGVTVVIVTHEARIAAYADRVATVHDGVVSSVDVTATATAARGVN